MQQEQAKSQAQPTQPANQAPQSVQVPASQVRGEYAGFWIRFMASMIDGLILSVVYMVLFFGGFMAMVFFGVGAASVNNEAASVTLVAIMSAAFFLWVLLWFGLQLFYYVYFTAKGATPGKRALGLRVVDEAGNNLDYGKAFLREVIGKWISGLIFGVGYLMVGFDEKKQGLHDKIAGSYVTKS